MLACAHREAGGMVVTIPRLRPTEKSNDDTKCNHRTNGYGSE